MLTTQLIRKALQPLPAAKQIFVAYSGGIDSHVLLHLSRQVPELTGRLTAVYVHHGLQAAAEAWAAHCQQVATVLGVGFVCLRVNAQAPVGVSPEEAARDARYQAFTALMAKDDVLLLAQHRDDQLETVLLQLFRGGGLQGLAGMPEQARLGQGWLLRPLLTVAKQAIVDYAGQQHLQWVEDPSNQSSAFDRNYLRNDVLPQLTQRWPALAATVSRAARHCGSAQTMLETHTARLFAQLVEQPRSALNLTKLAEQPLYQQHLLIRHWLRTLGVKMPSEALLSALFTQVIGAGAARDPLLNYQHVQFRRYREYLYALPKASIDKPNVPQPLIWPIGETILNIGAYSQLQRVTATSGIDRHCWQQNSVSVRFRQGGEKITLAGRRGQHTLKNLFQEAAIPPWQRETMPLIFINGQLAAVADQWISAQVWTDDPNNAMRLIWRHSIQM